MELGEESKLMVLTPRQYKILSTITDRLSPRGGAFALGALDMDVAESVDRLMGNLDRTMQTGLKMLLFLIEYSTFIFTRKFKRFTRLSPEDQDSYLKGWQNSRFYLRRLSFFVLKMLCLLIFYSDERIEKDVGYEPVCRDLATNY